MSMPDPPAALPALPALPVRTVTVTGVANATVRPDRAMLSLGVQARASSAREALEVAAQRATAVIAALHEAGVGEGDLGTTGISLWRDQSLYVASHGLNATIPPDDVGDHIDAAATAGGDEFTLNGVSFSVADPAEAIAPLRAAALADARAKADALADAEGCTVGDVITIVEGGGGGAGPFPKEALRARLATPIEVGSESLSIKVTATYQLLAAST